MTSVGPRHVRFIDSHTAGEPTRVILDAPLDLHGATLAEQCRSFAASFDAWRSAFVNEPRGSDVLVGALLVPPTRPDCAAGVIFFNNVGVLGMCGHGTIGLITTLAHLGHIQPGRHLVETPVGVVDAELHADGRVSVANVPAYRHGKNVSVNVPGYGTVTGDVAWGGNWFYLIEHHGQELAFARIEELTAFSWAVRQALTNAGVTGANGALIDHVELTAPLTAENSTDERGARVLATRNFVLCPGKAYDRSPCGTGTSAKLACLAEDGKLGPGETLVVESIIGTRFTGTYAPASTGVLPTITGEAFVTARGELILDERDPFAWGIRDGA